MWVRFAQTKVGCFARGTVLSNLANGRSENDEPVPVSVPTHSRYTAYHGAYAYLSTPSAADRGPSSDGLGLRETAFDRLKTPKSVALTHPKDPSLHLRAWQDGDGTGEEGAVRRPLSALSVGRPASALSLTHFSAAGAIGNRVSACCRAGTRSACMQCIYSGYIADT